MKRLDSNPERCRSVILGFGYDIEYIRNSFKSGDMYERES